MPSTLNIAWSAWLSSEYGLGRFSIWLPPGVAEAIYISAAGCGAANYRAAPPLATADDVPVGAGASARRITRFIVIPCTITENNTTT